jgi:outer membrane protein
MLKKLVLASVLSALVSVNAYAASNDSKAQSLSIAAVNIPYIMNEIPQSKAATEALQKEFAPRQQELVKIEQEAQKIDASMSKLSEDKKIEAQRKLAQMRADYQLKAQALQEDQRKRVQQENIKLGSLVQKAIDTIAKERGLQLVLRGEAVAYATNAADISSEVIARVKNMKNTNNGNKGKK